MTEEQAVTPEAQGQPKPEPKGIAGWLIIPAIGLVLGPIRSAAILFKGLNMIQSFSPELTSDPRLWLAGLIEIAMIIANVIVAVLFFKRRQVAVRAIIGLMLASVVANLVQVLLSVSMFKEVDIEPVIHACGSGAIWIPYFLKSKRVNNTFTEAACRPLASTAH